LFELPIVSPTKESLDACMHAFVCVCAVSEDN
jgi:hypothetical protein